LVVVDEQHRFGVAQRARLGRGGGRPAPHLLAMSATPIPRSLALALHGDLDASVLLERPSGRPPPSAVLCVDAEQQAAAYRRVREEIAAGRQAFVVCAVREEAGRSGAVTAVAHHRGLVAALAPARVGLLHGNMPAGDKEAALRAFASGTIDVLVATTVVELGIDVPNATVMVIEDADRFGMAQLHQLRGRVGRGGHAGICFLCAGGEAIGDEARARLVAVTEVVDGFRLAELDLAQRGFGDLLGTRQAGDPLGAEGLAELGELAAIARAEAERIVEADPALARPEHVSLGQAARARAAAMIAGEAG
jgi:ATP-dependent DNA helicase RecG